MGQRRSIESIVAGAVALLLAVPAALSAQTTQNYGECGTDGGVTACFGARITYNAGTLTLLLQNNSGADGPSRISGFALYDLTSPFLSATLVSAGIRNLTTNTLTALPADFLNTELPPGLNTGNGRNSPAAYQFTYSLGGSGGNAAQGGLVPCTAAGTLVPVGGSGMMLGTCSSPFVSALELTFTGVTGIQSAGDVNLAVRFQSVGNGSLRCFTSSGLSNDNCTTDPDNPGGGITGQVVPEPSTYALLGSGLLGLAGIARRRRRQG
jgi:hypothetical protein